MPRRAFARRLFEYALVAAILCLIPPLLWSEWTAPALLAPPSTIVPWQWRLFTVLVLPPAWIGDALRLSDTAFGCVVGASRCCFLPLVSPLEAAVGFWRVGVPFWLLVVSAAGELSLRAWRRDARRLL